MVFSKKNSYYRIIFIPFLFLFLLTRETVEEASMVIFY
jgi:hypothetical protein